MAATHVFSKKEELANATIHGIGAALSIVAIVLLVVFSSLEGTALHVVSFLIYGVTMLLLYLSSTLVHSFPEGKTKDLFEIFDHSAIYLFIAGSYTPLLFHVVQGKLGWVLFGVVWGMAVLGVVFKAFYAKKFLYTSTILYILMGWLIVFAWKPLLLNLSGNGLTLLIIGGLLYTVGTVFYVWRSFPYHHAIWHLFVLAGSIFHFFVILLYILP
ncbi:hemolysin III family protein [Paenibacillus psychroresistens]|uniref:Hemolysin III family protein n=1 Tax=Paenibacillus psychroresistens TaxID=1778678 RepID=A0A6B8RSX7_9BACL|nr:hemolysin III family protein [Paenibacillus psychroresistens]QGQ99550.1 hemolysin III family protein [Paenibacillus psychroresistens]